MKTEQRRQTVISVREDLVRGGKKIILKFRSLLTSNWLLDAEICVFSVFLASHSTACTVRFFFDFFFVLRFIFLYQSRCSKALTNNILIEILGVNGDYSLPPKSYSANTK